MILIKAYPVMDALVVELSCIHGEDPTQSHLLFREQSRMALPDASYMLALLSETVDRAARLVHQGELEVTDDCAL